MNILYVTPDTGGCRFYRCQLPGIELHDRRHLVCVTGHFCVTRSGEIKASDDRTYAPDLRFDIVVMQRVMLAGTVDNVKRARDAGQVVINDVDDSFWDIPRTHASFRQIDPARNPDSNRVHYTRALQASDAITVSTPYLAEKLGGLGPAVYLLPNAIDPARFKPDPVRDTWSPVIGWVGALSYREQGDIDILRLALGPFLRRRPDSRLVHVGARLDDPGVTAEVLNLDPDQVEVRPFCHVSDLAAAMRGIDVALAPLDDTPFNRAKSWIKTLEAAAAGIPVVASDMPEYRRLGVGKLCVTDQEWAQALEEVCDPGERLRLVAEGRRAVEANDIKRRWVDWLDVYRSLVPSHAGNAAEDAEATVHPV